MADELITLTVGATAESCFDLLLDGKVDAVSGNEFLGTEITYNRGLNDQVPALPKPVSIQGLHVVISKRHW